MIDRGERMRSHVNSVNFILYWSSSDSIVSGHGSSYGLLLSVLGTSGVNFISFQYT